MATRRLVLHYFPTRTSELSGHPGAMCWLRLCCCDSTAQVNLGTKEVSGLQVTSHHWGKSGQELKTGTWRQELKQRPKESCYWLPPHGLHSLLSYECQDHCPGMAQSLVNWVIPDPLLTKKASLHTCPQNRLMEANPQARLSLLRWLSLSQADRN